MQLCPCINNGKTGPSTECVPKQKTIERIPHVPAAGPAMCRQLKLNLGAGSAAQGGEGGESKRKMRQQNAFLQFSRQLP